MSIQYLHQVARYCHIAQEYEDHKIFYRYRLIKISDNSFFCKDSSLNDKDNTIDCSYRSLKYKCNSIDCRDSSKKYSDNSINCRDSSKKYSDNSIKCRDSSIDYVTVNVKYCEVNSVYCRIKYNFPNEKSNQPYGNDKFIDENEIYLDDLDRFVDGDKILLDDLEKFVDGNIILLDDLEKYVDGNKIYFDDLDMFHDDSKKLLDEAKSGCLVRKRVGPVAKTYSPSVFHMESTISKIKKLKKRRIKMGYTFKHMLSILENSKEGYQNSLDNESVIERVSPFGFTRERLQAALALNLESEKFFRVKGTKRGKKMGIIKEINRKLEECYKTVTVFRKILRRAFAEEPENLDVLQLNTPIPGSIHGRIKMIKEFYEVCLNSENLLTRVSAYGLTNEKLTAELETVKAIETDLLEKGLFKMADEKATHDRDKIFKLLIREWGIYREVLKFCYLEEDPQFLEGFGMSVPTGGFYKRKKKKEEEPVTETEPGEDTTPDETEAEALIKKCKEILKVEGGEKK